MPFEQGHEKLGGRSKGTENKDKKELRERVTKILDDNWDGIQTDLTKVKPDQRLNFLLALLEYSLPKLSRTELVGDSDQPIVFTGIKFIRGDSKGDREQSNE